jgi:type II secretory pathway component PulF|tara:strand:+ start:122 stop:520 length:399 start_codon:yes stop_codon:yes gene_type:complete
MLPILLVFLTLPKTLLAEEKIKPTVRDFSYLLYKHLEIAFPLLDSIERTSTIYGEDDKELYQCIDKAKNNLKQGKLFSNGLKKCPSYFSRQMVKMIKDGERNGLLNFVFRDFSDGIADGEFNKDDYCESISN